MKMKTQQPKTYGTPDAKTQLIGKDPNAGGKTLMLGKIEGRRGGDNRT